MAHELVRVVIGDVETNVGRAYAKKHGLSVLDGEPTHRDDGRQRPDTRRGRPVKPKTTVAEAAAVKNGGGFSAPTEGESE